jgi:hypothetical protein
VTDYLKALTMELTSLARVPPAGTNWIPGGPY